MKPFSKGLKIWKNHKVEIQAADVLAFSRGVSGGKPVGVAYLSVEIMKPKSIHTEDRVAQGRPQIDPWNFGEYVVLNCALFLRCSNRQDMTA